MATVVLAKENVSEFVQMYFELHAITDTTVQDICTTMYTQLAGKYKKGDIYNVVWAIRLLVETSKYDHDDIEFHVKKNPIFAEIYTEDSDAEQLQTKPKQVGLLRQTIRNYQQAAWQLAASQLKMKLLIGANAKL